MKTFHLIYLLALGACHASQTIAWPTTPGKFEIVNEKPRCYIPEAPIQPDKPDWPSSDDDYYRRIYVHRKDYETLFDYTIMMAERQEALIDCIKSVTDWY